jgi:PST family polysaccharide transporter
MLFCGVGIHWVPASIGVCYIAGGLACVWSATARYTLRARPLGIRRLWRLLQEGGAIFLGNLAVMAYRDANVLLLSAIGVGDHSVSTYSLAEKIGKGVQAAVRPLNLLNFPRVVEYLSQMTEARGAAPHGVIARTCAAQFYLIAAAVLVGELGIAAVVFSGVGLPLSGDSRPLLLCLAIMLPGTLCGVYNFMFGTVGLNALGARYYMLFAIVASAIGSVTICLGLAHALSGYAAAIAFLISELMLSLLILTYYFRRVRP